MLPCVAARPKRKARTVLIGIAVMLIILAIPVLVLSRYAGEWGVPYFSFTTERGSTCTNDFVGHHCDDVTVEDLRWWGELPLPDSTTVLSSHYKATHDFTLDAVAEVAKEDRRSTARALRKRFGNCRPDQPTPLDTTGLKSVCVMANDASDSTSSTAPMANTLYVITYGVQPDRTLLVGIHQESR